MTACIIFITLLQISVFHRICNAEKWSFLSEEPQNILDDFIAKEPSDSYSVIYSFIGRVLQNDSLTSLFTLEFIDKSERPKYKHLDGIYRNNSIFDDGMYLDIFELDNDGTTIILRGTSIIAITNAFGYYLDFYCNTTYDWSTYKVYLPPLPLPLPSYIRQIKTVPITFMNNEVTFSYSYTFWSWNEWQKHLDWYAINGINYPLAFTGQEFIWSKTFYEFGFNVTDLTDWFAGPGFFAWQRFGNMKSWGGPLREYYIMNEYNLQLQILARMNSFEMIPVLPCFGGHVPDAITTIYPNVDVTPSPAWAAFNESAPNYCCSLLLNFSDPLFEEIGSKFIEIHTKYYGTGHVYQCDSFNEEQPPSNDTEYLHNASSLVYKAIENVDVNAIWMFQTWMFYFSGTKTFWNRECVKAYLGGVSKDEVLLLDVYSDGSTVYNLYDSFYGLPFIWNTVSTFGGKDGFYGYLDNISVGLTNALQFNGTSVIGIGLMLEGIWTNYIIFDMSLKMAYHGPSNKMNESLFIDKWIYRRYGLQHSLDLNISENEWIINNLQKSWYLFETDIYNTVKYADTTITWPTPKILISKNDHDDNNNLNIDEPAAYDTAMMKIWQYYIQIGTIYSGLNNIEQFMHDLTDITRQCLGDIFNTKYQLFNDYYNKYNFSSNGNDSNNKYILNQTIMIGDELIEIIMDLDNILNTNKYYMVGRWIEWAKNKSNGNITNTKWLEFNARNQISLWGPNIYSGNYALNNYARKQWSGIIKDYYGSQWNLFINLIIDSMKNNIPFNQTYFDQQNFIQNQLKWVHQTNIYPTKPSGDTIQLSCKYFLKWNNINITSCTYSP